MQTFPATVKYSAGPPKDFGDGPKYNIVFEPNDPKIYARYREQGGGEKMRVNKPAAKAGYLKTLREGEGITVVVAGNTKDGYPWFDVLETNSQGGFATEDPIVDELLGPRQLTPSASLSSPTFASLSLPDESEQFGAWAADEASKIAGLYSLVHTELEGRELPTEPRAVQAMATSLYIQYNMDKKR